MLRQAKTPETRELFISVTDACWVFDLLLNERLAHWLQLWFLAIQDTVSIPCGFLV